MSRSTPWLAVIGLAALLSLLPGCASAPPPLYFRLDYPIPYGTAEGEPLDLVLAVPPVKAPETLARSNILYRVSPRVLQHYQSRYWEQSPAAISHQQLVRSLRAAGIFKRISTRRLALDADFSLTLNLTAFEEVVEGPGRTALVGARYELATVKPRDILLAGKVETGIQIPGGEKVQPEALAEAMSQALKGCLDEVVAAVAGKVRD